MERAKTYSMTDEQAIEQAEDAQTIERMREKHNCGAQGFDPMQGDVCLGCDQLRAEAKKAERDYLELVDRCDQLRAELAKTGADYAELRQQEIKLRAKAENARQAAEANHAAKLEWMERAQQAEAKVERLRGYVEPYERGVLQRVSASSHIPDNLDELIERARLLVHDHPGDCFACDLLAALEQVKGKG